MLSRSIISFAVLFLASSPLTAELDDYYKASLTLLKDDFNGSGSILLSEPRINIHGDKWKAVGNQLTAPIRDGTGRLTTNQPRSLAAMMLPPLSPHGELTVSAELKPGSGGNALVLGLYGEPENEDALPSGPMVRITDNGTLTILQDADTTVAEAPFLLPDPPNDSVNVVLLYTIRDNTLTASINGNEIATAVLESNDSDPPRNFVTILDTSNTNDAVAINSLRIDYVPVPRPQPMVADHIIRVTDTSREGIMEAIRQAGTTSSPTNIVQVDIPRGDYRFNISDDSERRIFTVPRQSSHVIIDWNESNIIIETPLAGLFNLGYRLEHVTVRNIASLDYPDDNLPFTQGTVLELDRAAKTAVVEFDEGFPLPNSHYFTTVSDGLLHHGMLALIDPDHPGRIQRGARLNYHLSAAEHLEGRRYHYTFQTDLGGVRVGSRFIWSNRGGETNQMFRIMGSDDIRLENITAHTASHFFIMLYDSRVALQNVSLVPKQGRLISGIADGATGLRNLLWVENCLFAGAMDDLVHQHLGKGTFIANSDFYNSRRFGVWFNTSEHGVVTGSRFVGLCGNAIVGMKEPGMREDITFASRNIICYNNHIDEMFAGIPAISLSAIHTRQHDSAHWNHYWRIVDNETPYPIRIQNATDVRGEGNRNGEDPASIRIAEDTCVDVSYAEE